MFPCFTFVSVCHARGAAVLSLAVETLGAHSLGAGQTGASSHGRSGASQGRAGGRKLLLPQVAIIKLLRFPTVLLAGDLDARLYLANRNGRQEELLCRYLRDPFEDGAMGTAAAQLRDHVGVEEIDGATPRPRARGGDAAGAAA